LDSEDDIDKKSIDYVDEYNEIVYKPEKRLPQPFVEDAKNHP